MASEDLFPIQQQEEDGVPFGFTSADLGKAVEIWYHAQKSGDAPKIIDAARAFNVSPEKIIEAVGEYASPFFWIERSRLPLGHRGFACDGL